MSSLSSARLFAAVLFAALATWQFVDIFVAGHFDGAIGDRLANLLLGAFLAIPFSLAATAGFWVLVGSYCHRSARVAPTSMWVVASALAAFGLLLAYPHVFPKLPLVETHPIVTAIGIVFVIGFSIGAAMIGLFLASGRMLPNNRLE